MFCERGYTPIGGALSEWKKHFCEKFEKEAASEEMENPKRRPQRQTEFDEYQKQERRLYYEDLFEFVRAKAKSKARKVSNELFFKQLEDQAIFVYDGKKTLKAAPEILEWVHESTFHEEFWSEELNELDEHSLDASTARKYASLTTFRDRLLCFVDPYTWSVDLRAIDVLRERVHQIIDPLRLKAWLDDDEINYASRGEDEPYTDMTSDFGKIQELIDDGEIFDDGETTLSQASNTQIMYFCEYLFPLLHNVQLEALRPLEGARLCVKESSWIEGFNVVKATTFQEANSRWPTDREENSSQVLSTVADERRAVVRVKAFLSKEDWVGTTGDLREALGKNLGARAWRRVLDEVRKEFPEISVPGRRPKRT